MLQIMKLLKTMYDELGGKVNGIDSNIPNTSNISQYATN